VSWAWWDWPSITNHCPSVLWQCWLGHLTCNIVSEMTYNVSSGMLNTAVLYYTETVWGLVVIWCWFAFIRWTRWALCYLLLWCQHNSVTVVVAAAGHAVSTKYCRCRRRFRRTCWHKVASVPVVLASMRLTVVPTVAEAVAQTKTMS